MISQILLVLLGVASAGLLTIATTYPDFYLSVLHKRVQCAVSTAFLLVGAWSWGAAVMWQWISTFVASGELASAHAAAQDLIVAPGALALVASILFIYLLAVGWVATRLRAYRARLRTRARRSYTKMPNTNTNTTAARSSGSP